MKLELKLISSYVRAVLREWWFIVVEVVLALTDIFERILGTWLLPSTTKKVAIGLLVLLIAQYRAYRAVSLELQFEKTRRTKLSIFPATGSALYVERPGNAARSIGFYLALQMSIQNDGDENSVIRKFRLEIEEIGRSFEDIIPTRRNMVQTRRAQNMMKQNWISQEPAWIVVQAHNVAAGILPFYVDGEVPALPAQVHCILRLVDADGTATEQVFQVRVED